MMTKTLYAIPPHDSSLRGLFFYVPEDIATTDPTSGTVIKNSWWEVHPEHGLLYYTDQYFSFASPQCNVHKAIVADKKGWRPNEIEFKFLPLVFDGHAVKYGHRLKDIMKQDGYKFSYGRVLIQDPATLRATAKEGK